MDMLIRTHVCRLWEALNKSVKSSVELIKPCNVWWKRSSLVVGAVASLWLGPILVIPKKIAHFWVLIRSWLVINRVNSAKSWTFVPWAHSSETCYVVQLLYFPPLCRSANEAENQILLSKLLSSGCQPCWGGYGIMTRILRLSMFRVPFNATLCLVTNWFFVLD